MGADQRGHTFYVANTRTGVRESGFNYNLPLTGTDPSTAWHGIVPFSKLPKAENPTRGYYMNANNDPVETAPGQIQAADFPSYLLTGGYDVRAYRLDSLLGPLHAATGADVERIGHDIHLLVADYLKPILAAAVQASGPVSRPDRRPESGGPDPERLERRGQQVERADATVYNVVHRLRRAGPKLHGARPAAIRL